MERFFEANNLCHRWLYGFVADGKRPKRDLHGLHTTHHAIYPFESSTSFSLENFSASTSPAFPTLQSANARHREHFTHFYRIPYVFRVSASNIWRNKSMRKYILPCAAADVSDRLAAVKVISSAHTCESIQASIAIIVIWHSLHAPQLPRRSVRNSTTKITILWQLSYPFPQSVASGSAKRPFIATVNFSFISILHF